MRTKVVFELLFFALVPLILISLVTVSVVRRQVIEDRLDALASVAQLQESRIESFLVERDLDYVVLLSNHWLWEASRLMGECEDNPNSEQMNTYLMLVRDQHPVALNSVTLLDHDGCVEASTNPDRVGDDLSNEPFFAESVHGGRHSVIQGAVTGDGLGGLTQAITGPLFLDNAHVGTILLDTNMGWLAAWAMDYTGLGETGETVFGRLSDDRSTAVFMTPLRFDPHASLVRTVPMTSLQVPIVQALAGDEARLKGSTDYRGVEVLAVTRRIPSVGWGIVVKMDRIEALTTVTNLTRFLTMAHGVLLVGLIPLAAALARRRTRPILAITDAAVAVASGDLDKRANVHVRDEHRLLADAVNHMAENLVERHRALEDEVRARTTDLRTTVLSLEHRSQDLERMAVVAAHDLSEPLRKIRVFGERLVDTAGDSLDERSRDYLDRMTSAAERMQDLIDGLLEYSRVASGAQPFEWVDLAEIVRSVVTDLEVAVNEAEARVEIGDLPRIMGEPTQLRQLFQNLISNSLKYRSPDDDSLILITSEILSKHTLETPGAVCRFTVEDRGIGIPEQHTQDVFNLFTRLHTVDEYPGAGLGLSICRRVVEHHRGLITIEPNMPTGTRVFVTLPIMPERGV
ncbi:MAG: ATP-binding protein, partial [Actinomycetota bacterium]|nr:ATP-binding protein [Actinomycetota bacterium]